MYELFWFEIKQILLILNIPSYSYLDLFKFNQSRSLLQIKINLLSKNKLKD
jgi:hypothetical protein